VIDPYRNPGPENLTVYFKIPLFSYKELEEATNNFHHGNQLGSGGFGIVYYGKSFLSQTLLYRNVLVVHLYSISYMLNN